MAIALVRAVTESFAQALTAQPLPSQIDVVRAREEHAAYVDALSAFLGFTIVHVPPEEEFPDGCFVEDTLVVAGGLAVLTRPGAPSRRGEVTAVARALGTHMASAQLEAGTLDGGDCLRLGNRVFVGRTARTNDDGIAALIRLFAPHGVSVTAVDVARDVLHLKCVGSPLRADLVLLAEGTLDPALFAPARVLLVPREEAYAANVVAHGGRALVADGHPRTRALVEAAGFETRVVDNRELRKADSALTCLSVLLAD